MLIGGYSPAVPQEDADRVGPKFHDIGKLALFSEGTSRLQGKSFPIVGQSRALLISLSEHT